MKMLVVYLASWLMFDNVNACAVRSPSTLMDQYVFEKTRMAWKAEKRWVENWWRKRRIANYTENTAERIGLDSVFHQYHMEHSWDIDRPRSNIASYGM